MSNCLLSLKVNSKCPAHPVCLLSSQRLQYLIMADIIDLKLSLVCILCHICKTGTLSGSLSHWSCLPNFFTICQSFSLDLEPKEALHSHMRNMFFQKLPTLVVFQSGKYYKFQICMLKYKGVALSWLLSLEPCQRCRLDGDLQVFTCGPLKMLLHLCSVDEGGRG